VIVSPSIDQILEGLLIAIDDEIMPSLLNPKAQATAQMMQSLIQGVRQMLPEMDEQLVDEHNDMIRTLADTATALGDATGAEAERIRDRAATLGQWDPVPELPDRAAIVAAHLELGRAIEATFLDLDELQRAGVASSDDALQVVRAHLAPRYIRDAETIVVGDGFVGRG
jgi:hypothetical protein